MKKFKEFPDKKDMTYWIIIISILFAVVVTWRVDNPETLSNQLSLGGTILSIFLAVIAIIFSFIQSSASSRQNIEMIDKFTNVTNTINSLNSISQSLLEQNKEQINKLILVEKLSHDFNEKISNLKVQYKDEAYDENIGEVQHIQKIQNEYIEQLKDIYKDEIPSSVTVFGNNSLYNLIKETYGGSIVYIQVIWALLYQKGIRIPLEELENRLKILESEGKLVIMMDDNNAAVKLLPINKNP